MPKDRGTGESDNAGAMNEDLRKEGKRQEGAELENSSDSWQLGVKNWRLTWPLTIEF